MHAINKLIPLFLVGGALALQGCDRPFRWTSPAGTSPLQA